MNADRPTQFFSAEYLKECARLTPSQILTFLEQFRLLHGGKKTSRCRLISLKMDQTLLDVFRTRCDLLGTPYQTQIKRLMLKWLTDK